MRKESRVCAYTHTRVIARETPTPPMSDIGQEKGVPVRMFTL